MSKKLWNVRWEIETLIYGEDDQLTLDGILKKDGYETKYFN